MRRSLQEDWLPWGRDFRVFVRGRRVLLHRDEYSSSSRAPSDRTDHRGGYCENTDHGGSGREVAFYATPDPNSGPCNRVSNQCRRPVQIRAIARTYHHVACAGRTGCASGFSCLYQLLCTAKLRLDDWQDHCAWRHLSLIHISEPTRRTPISYAVFCLKKKKKKY